MIRGYHGGGRGWGPAEQDVDIVGSDGQRAWVPGIRINQLIVSEFLCAGGPTAGGSGVYDFGGPHQEGTPLAVFPATVLPLLEKV